MGVNFKTTIANQMLPPYIYLIVTPPHVDPHSARKKEERTTENHYNCRESLWLLFPGSRENKNHEGEGDAHDHGSYRSLGQAVKV